jgi:hypothetical protein
MMTVTNWLSAFGVMLDIVGAIWIAKALAFSSTHELMDQASVRWDISSQVLTSLEHQRLDARCGLGVLGAGFAMQLSAHFFQHTPAWGAGAISVLTFVAVLIYYRSAKAREDGTRSDRVTKYILQTGRIP